MEILLWILGSTLSGILLIIAVFNIRRYMHIRRFRKEYYPDWFKAKKKHKVLLILPTITGNNGKAVTQKFLMLPGIALTVLAALTPEDWDVQLIFETIEKIPYDTDADLIGISSMGVGFLRGLDIAKKFRSLGKTVIMGGLMTTLNPRYALDNGLDSVCIGDAEGVWEKILRDFEKGQLQKIYDGRNSASLNWPVPRYDLIAEKRIGFTLPVMCGRGCPHKCEFCSIAASYKGEYFRRPVDEVIRDLKAVKRLGFRNILLLDDNIAADPNHAIKLFSEIEKHKVHWVGQCALYIADQPEMLNAAVKSGCITLSFGLETIHQDNLNSMDKTFGKVDDYKRCIKKIRDAGINVAAEFMFGLDFDDVNTFDKVAEFVIHNRIILPKFHVLTPVPGTPLFDRFDKEGRILHKDFHRYNVAKVVFQPVKLSPKELEENFWALSGKVFSISSILKRVFNSTARFSLWYKIQFLVINFHYKKYVRNRNATGMF